MYVELYEARLRFSGVTSLLLALVMFGLPYVPAEYELLRILVTAVLLVDGIVKLLNIYLARPISSALYSFAMSVALLTFFKVFGTPLSELFAGIFIVDGVLKLIPGNQMVLGKPEFYWRNLISAVVTILLGLSIMFGVELFGSMILGLIIGFAILVDGILKAEFLRIL